MRGSLKLLSSNGPKFRFNHEAYLRDFQNAKSNSESFWLKKSEEIEWQTRPSMPLDGLDWFPDGKLSTAFNCLDRHVRDQRGGMEALRFDSLITLERRIITYGELLKLSSDFARSLQDLDVKSGDCVLLYIPTLPEAVVALLGACRIGAPHCVVFAGFSPAHLAARMDHVKAKVIVTCDIALEGNKRIELVPLVKQALDLAKHKPKVICLNRFSKDPDHQFIDFDRMMRRNSGPVSESPAFDSSWPLYYLHTSGTTGAPKALVRSHGGHAVALRHASEAIMGMAPGTRYCALSDIGWVVGQSFSIYGPLLAGATSVIVEGKPVGCPDHLEWFRMLERNRVNGVFCSPTAIRAIKKEARPHDFDSFNLNALRCWFLAGEKCDSQTFHWLQSVLGTVPVCDNWWQSETGWPITTRGFLNSYGIAPFADGSSGLPVPGYDISISPHQDVLIKLPLPPGVSTRMLGDSPSGELFAKKYCSDFPGFYLTGDSGEILPGGSLVIHGRVDDVMNVAGHRLTTGQIEEAVCKATGVAECAVVAAADAFKGHVPVAFVVAAQNASVSKEEVVESVREFVGAFACLKTVHIVPKLPKTRSQKILRVTLRQIADHQKVITVPSTIEDESVIPQIVSIVSSKKH